MATQAETALEIQTLTAEVVAVKEQAAKAKDEIVVKIAALEDALDNSSGDTSPEVDAALADLRASVADAKAVTQALDDIEPDAPEA